MASALSAILTGVRDISPVFDVRYTPDAVLMRAYNRYQSRLLAKIADPARDSLIQDSTTITLSSYNWSAGGSLPESVEWLGGDVEFTDTNREPEDFTLVPYHQRNQPFFRWGGWINPKTVVSGVRLPILFLLGVEADWTGVSRVVLHRVQTLLGPLTGRSSLFAIPGMSDDVLVAYGAVVCARRAREQRLEVDVEKYEAEWIEAEELYIDQVTGRRRAKVGRATETW